MISAAIFTKLLRRDSQLHLYDSKGIKILDGSDRSSYEFKIALQIHHASDRKRYQHCFERINKMSTISLQLTCQINLFDSIVHENSDIT